MTTIDSHCHLNHERFDGDRDEAVARALAAGVELMINSANDVETTEAALAIADRHPPVYSLAGYHPHDAGGLTDETLARIEQLSHHPKVVGIGEIGLDYHYDFHPKDVQARAFVRQLELAERRALPVVIHVRDAFDDLLSLIDGHGWTSGRRGVIHCFTGTAAEAEACLERGFYLSIPGVVTFKNSALAPVVRDVIPLDRLLVETDSPYLAPVPFRGKRNEPAHVVHTAAVVAELKGMAPDELGPIAAANTRRLFGL